MNRTPSPFVSSPLQMPPPYICHQIQQKPSPSNFCFYIFASLSPTPPYCSLLPLEFIIMGLRNQKQNHVWCVQPLTPLMEGPDPESQGERAKKKSWELIRTWVRPQCNSSGSHFPMPFHLNRSSSLKRLDSRLVLGVLGCPLAPVPRPSGQLNHHFAVLKDTPIVRMSSLSNFVLTLLQSFCAATKL